MFTRTFFLIQHKQKFFGRLLTVIALLHLPFLKTGDHYCYYKNIYGHYLLKAGKYFAVTVSDTESNNHRWQAMGTYMTGVPAVLS